ncbi:MAG: DUF4910 domain-containing protein [Magnetococcales bacterium]|nr:DUF4910 domain-containing protein [Magnetococcales bacterium]
MSRDPRLEAVNRILERLFPITRSLTGEGNRETLRTLQEIAPIEIKEYASGEQVYDWVIPDEWSIRDAWIKDGDGRKVVDFRVCNVHVMGYSTPVHETAMTFEALSPHLHHLASQPEAIPYRTSYYKRDWGFCISHRQYLEMKAHGGPYEVMIDSTLQPGSMTVGEVLIPGRSSKEILISTYFCHPSLANDNLSGTVTTAYLAAELAKGSWAHSYRMVFIPETIGAIAYLAHNEAAMKAIERGFVVTCTAGPGPLYMKQSLDPSDPINRVCHNVLKARDGEFKTYPFDIHGSDERQYSSQGFRINVATIGRDKYYEYPQYHTHLDHLGFISAASLLDSLGAYMEAIGQLDCDILFRNTQPHGEVMLSRHDMYPATGGAQLHGADKETMSDLDRILWLLFHCDGEVGLWDVAQRLETDVRDLYATALRLEEKGLLERVHP